MFDNTKLAGWVELIQVRAAVGQADQVLEFLSRVKEERRLEPGLRIQFLSSGTHEGDFLVALIWPEGEPSPSGSELGQILAQGLSAFGLVHGTIWSPLGAKDF